jgi:Tol biopolymer transport system component
MKNILVIVFSCFIRLVDAQTDLQFISADSPRIFGPGIISDGFSNRDMAISPDGKELFYTLQWNNGLFSVILYASEVNGVWTKPETAWFSGRFNDLEPAFSPDGKNLFFTSNRPVNDSKTGKKDDYDIWNIRKTAAGWGQPVRLDSLINSDKDEFYPSVSRNGDLYFTRDNGESKDDIFFAPFREGKYEVPKALPDAINSKGYDFNAFIDPDENFMIFSSYKREDDLGGGDLYYSLRKGGIWSPAVHFGRVVNSSALDYSPFVSNDRRYFFFTSKKQLTHFPLQKPASIKAIREILNNYGNGNDDIYIMNFKVIQEEMERP